ncbi:MAG: YciI family protein [Hyphomicrobiales bacterium]
MHFVFYGKDKADSLQLRLDNRAAHIEWLKSNPIPIAGPLLDENGDMVGSMVVCEAKDHAAASTMFANDPYAKAGLFASSEITPWKWVIGASE